MLVQRGDRVTGKVLAEDLGVTPHMRENKQFWTLGTLVVEQLSLGATLLAPESALRCAPGSTTPRLPRRRAQPALAACLRSTPTDKVAAHSHCDHCLSRHHQCMHA